jgi:hypothetical protein
MASYTRQSTFADGDLITAALFNNEYNQLVDAFDNATGHKHDGTIGEGPVISVLGDAGLTIPLNKILIDTTNDHIEFFIDVSGTSTQQLYIADGAIVPTTDNDIDLGTNALQFKDLYLNGTANIDSLVADTIDINGGTIDGVTIGGTSAGAITGTTITGTSFVIGSATITETELEILDGATLSTTELNYVDGVTSSIQTQIDTKAPLASPSLTGIPTAPTAASNTNTTQIATTAYVQTEITELIAGAPGTLDTLNELAAAINDDANYNTTLTTALATKLPLAGGTMTGNVTYGDNVKANFGTSEDLQIYHDGSNSYITDVGTGNLIITGNLTGNVTGNVTGTVSDISNHSTSDLSEGTNLYYTDARVQAVSINNVVEDTTPQLGGNLASNGNDILFADNDKAIFGAGSDLQIFHNGVASVIQDSGTGNLFIQGSSAVNISSIGGAETYASFNDNGSVQLYYDNAVKLNTTATGINVTGTVTSDGLVVDAGENTLQATFAGTRSLQIKTEAVGILADAVAVFDRSSAVGSYQFRTNTGANKLLNIDYTGDISFYEDTGTSAALFWDASTERLGLGTTSPTTTLDVNGTIKYVSLSDGTITITGFADEDNMSSNSATLVPTQQSVKAYVDSQVSSAGGTGISFADNEKAQFGAGNDLQIYHDGSHSYVSDQGTGNLRILAENFQVKNAADNEAMIVAVPNAGVSLYYNNTAKLTTTSTGIDVTGIITTDGLTTSADINFGDNDKAIFGASNDLQIYHDAANGSSYISEAGAGNLYLQGSNLILEDINGGNFLYGTQGGDVKVYHNGSTKLATTSTGIDVTGTATMDGLTVSDGTETTSIPATADRLSFTGASLNYIQSAGSLFIQPTGDLVLNGSGAEIMRLKSGNVGIGTTSPGQKLHITTSAQPGLRLTSSSFGADYGLLSSVSGANKFGIYDYNASNYRLVIDSSGNVGIGTTSPEGTLHVENASNNALIMDAPANRYNAIGFQTAGVDKWWLGRADSDQIAGDAFFIGVDNGNVTDAGGLSSKLVIDSSGSVGIGTTSPATTLDVAGSGAEIAIRDTRNQSWTIGDTVASLGFYSDDASGSSGSTLNLARGAIDLVTTSTFGSTHDMVFKTRGDVTTSALERLRITSSGRVGIGTTSPSQALDVVGAIKVSDGILNAGAAGSASVFNEDGTTADFRVESSGNTHMLFVDGGLNRVGIGTTSPASTLEISKNDQTNGATLSITNSFEGGSWTAGDTVGTVDFRVDDGSTTEKIRGQIKVFDDTSVSTTYPAYNAMSFSTGNLNTLNERMRIDSSGKVGIGTTAPADKLHVNSGTTNTVATFESTDATARIVLKDNSGQVHLNGIGDNLTFGTSSSGTERLRITSSGNVGIGTSSPSAGLQVAKGSSTIPAAGASTSSACFGNDASDDNYGVVVGANSNGVGYISSQRTDGTATTYNLSIQPNGGNVGIGTTSPNYKLEINHTGADTFALVLNDEDTVSNATGLYLRSTSEGRISFGSGAALTFAGAGGSSERMRIDSSGNVLVGTTSVQGSGGVTLSGAGYVYSSRPSSVAIYADRTGSDGAIQEFRKDGTTVGSIATTSGAINLYGGSGTNGITIDSSGNVTATGNVTAYSDERLKDNIQTLQGSKVLEMRGVSYTKDGEASSGVIAQEIEKVAPELVHTAKDEMGTKSVAYGNLVGYLIEAIKDQQKEIEYMKSEIKTLKENK